MKNVLASTLYGSQGAFTCLLQAATASTLPALSFVWVSVPSCSLSFSIAAVLRHYEIRIAVNYKRSKSMRSLKASMLKEVNKGDLCYFKLRYANTLVTSIAELQLYNGESLRWSIEVFVHWGVATGVSFLV